MATNRSVSISAKQYAMINTLYQAVGISRQRIVDKSIDNIIDYYEPFNFHLSEDVKQIFKDYRNLEDEKFVEKYGDKNGRSRK